MVLIAADYSSFIAQLASLFYYIFVVVCGELLNLLKKRYRE